MKKSLYNGAEIVLTGHGIYPHSDGYDDKARYLRAAMLASAAHIPDTAAALIG